MAEFKREGLGRGVCDVVQSRHQNKRQPRSQGLSSLPPLVLGTETLVAAGHLTTQNLGGGKICWKGGATGFFIVTVTNLLRQGESGMSLDSVVFALKSCFKTKHQKSFPSSGWYFIVLSTKCNLVPTHPAVLEG